MDPVDRCRNCGVTFLYVDLLWCPLCGEPKSSAPWSEDDVKPEPEPTKPVRHLTVVEKENP